MMELNRVQRAACFRRMNLDGGLLLPNAWDAASAKVFEDVGFPAIATTSAGIANARGFPDGELIGRDAMVGEIAVIARAVSCPVSADIESGYGSAPGDVAATVDAVLAVGVSGVNIEDNTHRGGPQPLYRIDKQAARIRAARRTADRAGIPLVINARTDTFLLSLGQDIDERVVMTIERGRAYLAAGADLVFIPVLTDPALIRFIADAIDGPLSVMALPGAPPASMLFAAGARRVSLGNAAMLAALGALRRLAEDVRRNGHWTSIERTFYGFAEADKLFQRLPRISEVT